MHFLQLDEPGLRRPKQAEARRARYEHFGAIVRPVQSGYAVFIPAGNRPLAVLTVLRRFDSLGGSPRWLLVDADKHGDPVPFAPIEVRA